MTDLSSYLDFANHHADATEAQIRTLCTKVIKYHFHAAFVNPCYIPIARNLLPPPLVVGTVISFPLGGDTLPDKIALVKSCLNLGADEIDISLNVGLIKSGRWDESLDEMKVLVSTAKEFSSQKIVKFILETGLLTDDEIKQGSENILAAKADFIKTSSGFGPRGASLKDIGLIKQAVGDQIKIKVAGGISTYQQALSFVESGVARIGTSHAEDILLQTPKAS